MRKISVTNFSEIIPITVKFLQIRREILNIQSLKPYFRQEQNIEYPTMLQVWHNPKSGITKVQIVYILWNINLR